MNAVSYKCPNCKAGLPYDPQQGLFACEYCGGSFSRERVEQQHQADEAFAGHISHYACPSCGAEVMCEDTVSATICFYCHNPVILKGKLTGHGAPDRVIPFSIDHDQVRARFHSFVAEHRYVQDEFCTEAQQETLTGIYFPFWIIDATLDAELTAAASETRIWTSGDTEYTETKEYQIERSGEVFLNDITLRALDKTETRLLDGIYPFDTEKLEPFHMSYLSGFQANVKNVEQEDAQPQAQSIMENSAAALLQDTICGYAGTRITGFSMRSKEQIWLYTLMPVWMMTYDYRGEKYYFALNGQTGKMTGRVPASGKKINTMAALVGVAAAVLTMLAGWLLI